MKTIEIQGRQYVPVAERVKEFHVKYPKGRIETEILSNTDKSIVFKAVVILGDELPLRSFTGHSQAEWGKGRMGAVALEVCETSAVGRALGFANIGLIDGIASADEMNKASNIKKVTRVLDSEDAPF